MTAARQLRAALAPARAVERRTHEAHGQRSRWRVDVFAPGLDGLEHVAYTTSGEGPLGRLRAHQRARDWAERAGLALAAIELDASTRALSTNRAFALAAIRKRLRAEGVF